MEIHTFHRHHIVILYFNNFQDGSKVGLFVKQSVTYKTLDVLFKGPTVLSKSLFSVSSFC